METLRTRLTPSSNEEIVTGHGLDLFAGRIAAAFKRAKPSARITDRAAYQNPRPVVLASIEFGVSIPFRTHALRKIRPPKAPDAQFR